MVKEELILIVDDDDTAYEHLCGLIGNHRIIQRVHNGKEASEFLADHVNKVLLVLTEVQLPLLDGVELIKLMKENHAWAQIPIAVITKPQSKEMELQLWKEGINALFLKDTEEVLLAAQIENLISRIQRIRALEKDYILQKTLIQKTARTFFCIYGFRTGWKELENQKEDSLIQEIFHIYDTDTLNLTHLVLPKDKERAEAFFDIAKKDQLYDEIELRLCVDSVHYEWYKIAVVLQCNSTGRRERAAFLFTNIEDEIESKERLTFMAKHDVLTHIPNMRTFADDVHQLLGEFPDEQFVMIAVDIYQFRLMNKLFGYNEGDNVLRYLATKLQEIIESFSKGVYCRMASDVFYACLSANEDMEKIYQTLQEEMSIYPIKYELKLCFGIYQIIDSKMDVEEMIEHASYARMMVKKNPRQLIRHYDEKMQEKEYFEAVVVAEVEQALQEKQFEIYYQPKCKALNGEIIGAEALIRWNNPELGYISPGIFIPIFEENGLITELDYYVYDKVCSDLRRWLDEGRTVVPISVNVSRCDLYDSNLLKRILVSVEKYQIPHDLIEFEITESAFITEKAPLERFTEDLRKHGFRTLIDDFGSGYSSLNFLKNIEADVLKIDILFLPISTEDEKSPIILEEVIQMAKKLKLDIIAEGVETKEQQELLIKLGCDKIQGYYFYRPMDTTSFQELIDDKK